ncbi:hypothetical protein K1T71_008249 [Dendrolimus kikuchii]|uniref:Uncharacterized protein n=1 Tax=Dendrolimus kikuchii TaxID=765133 RepID=A0ACC1CX66_9NEOP|nr:hypothetical protein K1T71_008249 [Dendrolimus kikuchii]
MDEQRRSARGVMVMLWILVGLATVVAVKVVIEPLPKVIYQLINFECCLYFVKLQRVWFNGPRRISCTMFPNIIF